MKNFILIAILFAFVSCNSIMIQEEPTNKQCWEIVCIWIDTEDCIHTSSTYFYGTAEECDAVIARADATHSCYYNVIDRHKELVGDCDCHRVY